MSETVKRKAGRPVVADNGKNRTFRLTDAQYAKMKLLGGVKWLKSLLGD